jgi:hypothetical protein
MKIALVVLFSAIFSMAALLNEFSFTGIIKNVKEDQVTVLCQGQTFTILKSDILNGIVSAGEPIYFKISGEKMQSIFFKTKPAQKKANDKRN